MLSRYCVIEGAISGQETQGPLIRPALELRLVARQYAQRHLADRRPLRGVDAETDKGLERFDELVVGVLKLQSLRLADGRRARAYSRSISRARQALSRNA